MSKINRLKKINNLRHTLKVQKIEDDLRENHVIPKIGIYKKECNIHAKSKDNQSNFWRNFNCGRMVYYKGGN